MRLLLVLLVSILVAAPAAAERPRTGWNGQQGFSHYFPLSPQEPVPLMALEQVQRASPSCGWAGCQQASAFQVPQNRTDACGWAGCHGGGNAASAFVDGGFRDRCGWAGCRQGSTFQVPQSRTDVCGWAGCRGGSNVAPAFVDGGFRDRCGWAGCR